MASIRDRVGRLETEHAPPAGPGPSEDYDEYVRQMNAERTAIDAADREALGNPADFDFGDDPEPGPVPVAEERETVDEGWYGDMLLELRAEITDDHPKAEVMDIAIAQERKKQQRQKGRNDEEPS
jgi:hypothetical protein